MFWSGETIAAWAPKYEIIEPFIPKQIDCASYTLRMGAEYYVTPEHSVGLFSARNKQRLEPPGETGYGGTLHIPPGQFAFLLTEEYLRMPNHVLGFISLKSHWKFRGLINVSGFHVDPGFEGHLIYSVYNAGPRAIHLQRGQDLFLIWFSEVDKTDTKYHRDDSDRPQRDIDPKLITDVAYEILSLQNLSRKIDSIESKIKLVWSAGVVVVGLFTILAAWGTIWDYLVRQFPALGSN